MSIEPFTPASNVRWLFFWNFNTWLGFLATEKVNSGTLANQNYARWLIMSHWKEKQRTSKSLANVEPVNGTFPSNCIYDIFIYSILGIQKCLSLLWRFVKPWGFYTVLGILKHLHVNREGRWFPFKQLNTFPLFLSLINFVQVTKLQVWTISSGVVTVICVLTAFCKRQCVWTNAPPSFLLGCCSDGVLSPVRQTLHRRTLLIQQRFFRIRINKRPWPWEEGRGSLFVYVPDIKQGFIPPFKVRHKSMGHNKVRVEDS